MSEIDHDEIEATVRLLNSTASSNWHRQHTPGACSLMYKAALLLNRLRMELSSAEDKLHEIAHMEPTDDNSWFTARDIAKGVPDRGR